MIGANGSGKSTLLKAAFGLCDTYAGTVEAAGRDITGVPTHRLAGMGVSYVAQRGNVFPGLTVEENLRIAARGPAGGALGAFPELAPLRRARAGALSGGQRQLLAMAACMAAGPRACLLDEPTAALSPPNAAAVLSRVRRACSETGAAMVLVEQNVRQALAACDSVCLLAGGRVAYSGPPSGLEGGGLAARFLGWGDGDTV